MPVYLFQLGHQPLLSRAEIKTVLAMQNIALITERQTGDFLLLESKEKINAPALIKQLGGTIKILEQISAQPKPESITDYLNETIPSGKINFSLTGGNFALQIKKELKNLGRSVRYIEPKNTATILHNDLIKTSSDLVIFEKNVFVTRGIQDLEGFSQRDYERPKADSKSGMLPPKLARLMINLSGANHDEILLDPFCGSGTVLMEAADLGFINLAGADLSSKAILDTTKNLEWVKENKKIKPITKLKVIDAQKISQEFPTQSIGAIIAEPFMGKPQTGRETKQQLITTARELRQLYENAFAEFQKILKPKATIVFIIPEFSFQKEVIAIDCIEAIKKLGFSVIPLLPNQESILYKRPNQHVARRVWKFQLQ